MSEAKASLSESALDAKVMEAEAETLAKGSALGDFLKANKDNLKAGMSEADFTAAYDAQVKSQKAEVVSESASSNGAATRSLGSTGPRSLEEKEYVNGGTGTVLMASGDWGNKNNEIGADDIDAGPGKDSILNVDTADRLSTIVLKFTTLSEANTEDPSFTITEKGASVGRDKKNEVCVPSDARLAAENHAFFQYEEGKFYLHDRGYDCAAALRIGVGANSARKWRITDSCRFSVGNSIFLSKGVDADGQLLIEVLDGPLKGETKTIDKNGATIGRSSDNSIAVPDRELSRRHSKIVFDEELNSFLICDVGSTNGTYVQLVGPYGGRYRLHINDHILVGRTGFSINRFDYGISEEIGFRQTMEDSCAIVQHLGIGALAQSAVGKALFPASYFAVYDGHGGAEASAYLSRTLHDNIALAIEDVAHALCSLLSEENRGDLKAKQEATR